MRPHSRLMAVVCALWAAPALADPITIESCGGSQTLDQVPLRAVTLNQQATEVMLALGLETRMAGTAYLDDGIPEQWLDAYETVPVLADGYPAREVVLAANPDFLFAGFGSAFGEDNLGAEAEWHALGIGTYLADASCADRHPDDVPLTVDPILRDVRVIGQVFQVAERAEALAADLEARLTAVADRNVGGGQRAFFFDSGTDQPYSAGCCGGPALLMQTVGLQNIAADVDGRWVTLSWEAVVSADPDLIVLNEAVWSTAEEKIDYLRSDPVLAELRAVQEGRFVTVPFSETLLGMRFADGVERLAGQLEVLD